MPASFQFLDQLVVAAYLLLSLSLGIALRRQKSRDDFFAAGHSMGRLTVGLSVMATLFSANSFVMYPSTAYANSLRILVALAAFWAMGPLVVWVFIPVYARLKCETAYEYLEHRFHVSVRCLASALFILLRIAWMSAATFAASVAIAGISGIPQLTVTIGLGVVAIIYTMLGGLRAVMWTDVLQFFVFFGTIVFATMLLLAQSEGGATQVVETYFSGRDKMLFDFRLNPTIRFGTIAVFVGSFLEGLSAFGADQVAVQRYIAARDARTSQTGFWINLLGLSIVIPGLVAMGVGLYAYFQHQPGELAQLVVNHLEQNEDGTLTDLHQARIREAERLGKAELVEFYQQDPRKLHADVVELGLNDQVLPLFVKHKFPAGVIGLLVAALMAATMSSLDSGIHSITTAVVVDFRDRLFPSWRPSTEAREMFVVRFLVVFIGALAILLACYVGQLGDVFAVAKKTVGAFAAPLLAVFILGLFVPRATAAGVLVGTWTGALFTLWFMYQYDDWFSLWYFPVGVAATLGFSLVLSFVLPSGWLRNRGD